MSIPLYTTYQDNRASSFSPPQRVYSRVTEHQLTSDHDELLPLWRQWSYPEFIAEHLRFRTITDPEQAQALVLYLAETEKELALDFETTRSDIRLIQVGITNPSRQWVFDCYALPVEILAPLLARGAPKLIHFSPFEQGWARRSLGITIDPVFDTCLSWRLIQKYLKTRPLPPPLYAHFSAYSPHANKLTTLCEQVLGFPLPKAEQLSNWGARRLRHEQLVYAALDVAVLGELAHRTRQVLELMDLQPAHDYQVQRIARRAALK
jgi:ribonuclease D